MDRVVLRLMRDERGEVSFLFGRWGAVDRAEAIRQIESGERAYILQRQDGSHARFAAVGEGDSKRLTAFAHGADLLRADLLHADLAGQIDT